MKIIKILIYLWLLIFVALLSGCKNTSKNLAQSETVKFSTSSKVNELKKTNEKLPMKEESSQSSLMDNVEKTSSVDFSNSNVKIDAEKRTSDKDRIIFDFIDKIIIPGNFTKTSYSEIFTKDNPSDVKYTVFSHYFIEYSAEDGSYINIAFKEGERVLSDTLKNNIFSLDINGIEVIMSEEDKNLYAYFEYNNIYFDISCFNVTKSELESFIQLIIS